ncbi:Hypothetical predicted protein [Lecanosticta acicola]|uniref:Pre-rRNA-processing protein TSR2 n=1 Tax=Lecanosticta acicola TaxID=111012 RepID=A0AAI8YSP3_9PEZI|nr:Hypothetical predicted protein [Lecanosticta acicola]
MATTPAPPPQASPEQLQSAFDSSIWYLLSLWHPLHIAVTSQWGGPDSADKRDWFAGAVSDLLTTRPETDPQDLEEFLLNIMNDEFDCNVEDESEAPVARDILLVRKRLLEEHTTLAAQEVESRWRNRGQMKGEVNVQVVQNDVGDDEDWEEEEEDDEDEEGEAPRLVPVQPKEKMEPEVDQDGFTKVVGKKKR